MPGLTNGLCLALAEDGIPHIMMSQTMHIYYFSHLSQDGPGPKSCHTMCYDSKERILYVLGGYVDESALSDHLSIPPPVSCIIVPVFIHKCLTYYSVDFTCALSLPTAGSF